MELQVFLVHGFRSHGSFMSSFIDEYKNDHIHFKTAVHNHNWFAGVPRHSIEVGFRLFFEGRKYADECHDDWNEALNNIANSSDALSESINACVDFGGDVLIVSHSLGCEVTRLAIGKIRSDINIYLFLMGGVSNDVDYDDVLSLQNVHLAYNFYSNNDFILNDVLPNMDGEFVTPIGAMKCYNDKVMDVNINKGHSDYFNSKNVLSHYTFIVRKLVEKGDDRVLTFSKK